MAGGLYSKSGFLPNGRAIFSRGANWPVGSSAGNRGLRDVDTYRAYIIIHTSVLSVEKVLSNHRILHGVIVL